MKGFLLDENIPQNVTFMPALPVIHARDLGESVSDTTIWSHARENDLVIVSKDADFPLSFPKLAQRFGSGGGR